MIASINKPVSFFPFSIIGESSLTSSSTCSLVFDKFRSCSSFISHSRIHRRTAASASTLSTQATPKLSMAAETAPSPSLKLLFVEMGVGYDQHGQDITSAAMRACRDAISSNSIPAFRKGNFIVHLGRRAIKLYIWDTGQFHCTFGTQGSIPGVTFNEMKLQIKLGVPRPVQNFLDIEKVKSVFPYGKILDVEVVDGGLICSSGVHVEEMGDKNEDCYIVNAAVYVGY